MDSLWNSGVSAAPSTLKAEVQIWRPCSNSDDEWSFLRLVGVDCQWNVPSTRCFGISGSIGFQEGSQPFSNWVNRILTKSKCELAGCIQWANHLPPHLAQPFDSLKHGIKREEGALIPRTGSQRQHVKTRWFGILWVKAYDFQPVRHFLDSKSNRMAGCGMVPCVRLKYACSCAQNTIVFIWILAHHCASISMGALFLKECQANKTPHCVKGGEASLLIPRAWFDTWAFEKRQALKRNLVGSPKPSPIATNTTYK